MRRLMKVPVFILVLFLGVFLSGCNNQTEQPDKSDQNDSAQKQEIAVYYLKSTDQEIYLVREVHQVEKTTEVAQAALNELIKGDPITPDAYRVLPEDTRILGINIDNGLATVDFSPEVLRANVGSSGEGSSLAMAGGPIAKREGTPVIGCSPTNPAVTLDNDFYFRVCFIDPFQGTVMSNYATETLGAKTAAIIQDVQQDYSVGLSNYFEKAFKATNGDAAIVVKLNYNTVRSNSWRIRLTNSINSKDSWGFMPAAGSSKSSSWGSVAKARAISRRRCFP